MYPRRDSELVVKGTKIPIRPPGWHFASTFGHHPA